MEWENAFSVALAVCLGHAVWETCLIVEFVSFYIVDLKIEGHVTCMCVVVVWLSLFFPWLQNFALPTQCPNPDPRVPKPKPHQMLSPQSDLSRHPGKYLLQSEESTQSVNAINKSNMSR